MAKNSNLHNAKKEKNDEFYTQLTDIEKEMKHYKDHFKDKVIFCNCDDPEWSNFWRFFSLQFERLGLKRLISTHFEREKPSYMLEMWKDDNGEIHTERKELQQNGDFRSPECVELLKQADIVVTNPPFSLFREYVAQLMEYGKKFIILGNMNAVTYKEFFPLLKDNKVWAGFSFNKTMEFIMPDSYELKGKAFIDENGKKHGFVPAISWFTNLDIKKRHEELIIFRKYSDDPSKYPKYDNYDAINVDKVSEIPCDYFGVMGVPITFLDKFNPEQFEILGCTQRDCHKEIPETKTYDEFIEINYKTGKPTGCKGSKTNGNGNLVGKTGKNNYFFNEITKEEVHSCYGRIFIRRKGDF